MWRAAEGEIIYEYCHVVRNLYSVINGANGAKFLPFQKCYICRNVYEVWMVVTLVFTRKKCSHRPWMSSFLGGWSDTIVLASGPFPIELIINWLVFSLVSPLTPTWLSSSLNIFSVYFCLHRRCLILTFSSRYRNFSLFHGKNGREFSANSSLTHLRVGKDACGVVSARQSWNTRFSTSGDGWCRLKWEIITQSWIHP